MVLAVVWEMELLPEVQLLLPTLQLLQHNKQDATLDAAFVALQELISNPQTGIKNLFEAFMYIHKREK